MRPTHDFDAIPATRCLLRREWARALATALFSLCISFPVTAAAAAPAGPPPQVTVATVIEQDVNQPAEYIGHVEAIQAVDLQARVSGLLEKVAFKEGSRVRAGDLLYVIEQAPYKARVAAARARVTKAEAALTKADNYLKRIQNVRSGGISAADIEAAEADQLSTGAELQEARAALALAELDLAYTRITAPISGRIGATALTRGNLCGPSSGPLARIVQLDPIRVLYSVSENDLEALNQVQADAASGRDQNRLQPRIRLRSGDILPLTGHVDFVDNVVDPGTGTIQVRLAFDNPDGLLLPGQYVTILLSRRDPELLPTVPQSAVLEDRDGRYVLVVNADSQVEQRRIVTGPLIGSHWAVASGVRSGEQVIVLGLQKVRPGQTVSVVPPAGGKD